MSFQKALGAFVVLVCMAAPAVVRAQGEYLDVEIVKVKPEKTAEFRSIVKRWAEANRKHNGDTWIAMETAYGEGGVFQFVSTRNDYADVDKGNDASAAALEKAFGKAGAEKINQDFYNCLEWIRTELRHRRSEFTRKPPADPAAYYKLIGTARLLRMTAVHVRPGHALEFEALLKELKEAGDRNPDTQTQLVSQTVEGNRGTTYYVTTVRTAMSGFDHNPTLKDLVGEEGVKKFQHENAENVQMAESAMYRFVPELSNPPEGFVKADPDFWTPKMTAKPAGAKAKAAAKEPAAKP